MQLYDRLKELKITWRDCLQNIEERETSRFVCDIGCRFLKGCSSSLSDLPRKCNKSLEIINRSLIETRSTFLRDRIPFAKILVSDLSQNDFARSHA